jgi:hypothetical protein
MVAGKFNTKLREYLEEYRELPSIMRYAHLNSLFPVPCSLKPETLCLTIMGIAIVKL